MNIRVTIVLACLVFLPQAFLGHFAYAETISDAVQHAIDQHPNVEEAYAVQKSLHEDTLKERSNYFPTISASTSVGRVYGDNATSRGLNTVRGSGYSGLWEGSISINQMLFDGLRTPKMIEAARAREAAATAGLKEVKNALGLQTALAYMKVLRSREGSRILKEHEAGLTKYKNRIEKMVKGGGSDKVEALEAELVIMQLENMIVTFQGQVLRAEAEYKQLTGHAPPEDMFQPNDVATLPEGPDAALEVALQYHPQLDVSTQQMEAAKLTIDAKKASLYPDITVELSAYKKDVKDVIGGEVDDNRAVVHANWDMSTGGAEFADIRKAKFDHAQASSRKEYMMRQLEQGIFAAYADMGTSDLQRKIIGKKVFVEQDLLEAQKQKFEGGKVSVLQLQQAENRLLKSRIDLLEAEYRSLAAQYSILGSIGQIQQYLAEAAAGAQLDVVNDVE